MQEEAPRTNRKLPTIPPSGIPDNPQNVGDLEPVLRIQGQLLDAVEQAVIATDLEGTIVFWNKSAETLYGWEAAEVLGCNIIDVVVTEDYRKHANEIMATLASGRSWQGEFTVLRRDGGSFLARITDTPLHAADGELIGIIGLSRDLTQRRELEVELREQKDTLEVVNRIGMILSAELDLNKLMQAVTDATTELTDAQFGAFFYNVSDAQGGSYMLFTLSGVPREHFDRFPMPRATDLFGPTFRGDGVVRIADVKADPRYGKNSPYYGMPPGHLPVTSYLAVPVISRSGAVLGGLFLGHAEPDVFSERVERMVVALAAQAAIAIDNANLFQAAQIEIEVRKRTEDEMIRAKETAEAASRAKDLFLAMLSHELRAPLTPALAAVHVLETDENMPDDFRSFIEIIHRNIELEARLIDDLLDLTRITKGTLQLNVEHLDIHALIEHVVDLVDDDLRQRTMHLTLNLDAAQHTLAGDPARLQQVLWNLVKNAIKFTSPEGSITIATSNSGDGWVVVKVTDTGIGIQPELLPHLFNAFEQGEKTISRTFGGLGLGLAISRKILELHGGRLNARSQGHNKGATFTAELPGAL